MNALHKALFVSPLAIEVEMSAIFQEAEGVASYMMTDKDSENYITILVQQAGELTEIKLPVNQLKAELDKLLEQLETLAKPLKKQTSFAIEELQFNLAITNDGKLALLSSYVTNEYMQYTIKLCVKRLGQDWKISVLNSNEQQSEKNRSKNLDIKPGRIYSSLSRNNVYKFPATATDPALIIFLLDISASMNQQVAWDNQTRIENMSQLLTKILIKMVQRSTKGTIILPRYRVGMYAYSSTVIDVLGGILTIDEVAKKGVPQFTTLDMSDMAAAFIEVEQLLLSDLPNYQDSPAPLIFHITDAEFNGSDPLPIAQRIMQLGTKDGNVLIANITYSGIMKNNITDIDTWLGIQKPKELNPYGQMLFEMSSIIPESYCSVMGEFGYKLSENSRMLYPAKFPDLIEIAFSMSGATPVTKG